MDNDRIKQLVDDTLRPSGPWMAIAPDTWARACEQLLSEVERLREDYNYETHISAKVPGLEAEIERLREEMDLREDDGVLRDEIERWRKEAQWQADEVVRLRRIEDAAWVYIKVPSKVNKDALRAALGEDK